MVDLVRIGIAIFLFAAGIGWVGDFVLLRWVVFLGVGYLLITLLTREIIGSNFKTLYVILFISIIYIFNPIFPIYLYDIGIWRIIDLVSAAILISKPILINKMSDLDIENERFKAGLMSDREQSKYLSKQLAYDSSRFQNNLGSEITREAKVDDQLSVKKWVITLFVIAIPVINLMFLFYWAFGTGNNPRRNYSRAFLIVLLITLSISVSLFILGFFLEAYFYVSSI